MGNAVEVRFEYGGLILTCDEGSFARLRAHIRADPSIVEATRGQNEGASIVFISVRQTKADAALTNPSWLSLIPTIIAICILGVALVIGYVTNVRWLMRLGT